MKIARTTSGELEEDNTSTNLDWMKSIAEDYDKKFEFQIKNAKTNKYQCPLCKIVEYSKSIPVCFKCSLTMIREVD